MRPITTGTRFRVAPDFAEITASKPEKSLLEPIKRSGGRNNQGRRTMRYIGGGHKRHYRIIDFKRDKVGQPAEVRADRLRNEPFCGTSNITDRLTQ